MSASMLRQQRGPVGIADANAEPPSDRLFSRGPARRPEAEPAPAPEPAPTAQPARTVRISLSYKGVPVELTRPATKAEDVEKLIDGLLAREGWAAPAPPPAPAAPATPRAARPAGRPKAATTVRPEYDGDGSPCCPVHGLPLQEGQYGLFCSSKAQGTQSANAKGYCNLRFTEE